MHKFAKIRPYPTAGSSRVCCSTLLLCFFLLGFRNSGQAQISVNVTNYGAVGDAVQFYVNTTSDSALVTTTSQLSTNDIGKVIELFGVGLPTSGIGFFGNPTNANQDMVTTISDVVNGTNIYLSYNQFYASNTNFQHRAYYPFKTATNVFATYGTDNGLAFSNAIAAASAPTGTIIVPPGTYLIMPEWVHYPIAIGYGYAGILLNRGGIHFQGSGTNTILLDRGAWLLDDHDVFGANTPLRGGLMQCCSPVTSDYPMTLDGLVFDGGNPIGNDGHWAEAVNPVDGLGSGGENYAYLSAQSSGACPALTTLIITNCVFQNFHAETVIAITPQTNQNYYVFNSTFQHINFQALNLNGGGIRSGNLFNDLNQICEEKQAFFTNTTWWVNNIFSNTASFSVDVGATNAMPFYFSNNVYFVGGGYSDGNAFILGASDIQIISNTISSTPGFTLSMVLGINNYGNVGGDDVSENITFANNSIVCTNTVGVFFGYGATPVNNICITNNTVSAPQVGFIIEQSAGPVANVTVANNNFIGGVAGFNMSKGTPVTLFQTNNSYTPYQVIGNPGTTNLITYGGNNQSTNRFSANRAGSCYGGYLFPTYYVAPGTRYILDDLSPTNIPNGATMTFDDSSNQNGAGASYFIQPSTASALNTITVTDGEAVTFYWSGDAWTASNIPIIQVSPATLSYGTVLTGKSVTNSITVQNVGGGILGGVASVGGPFSILSGGTYSLGANQSQTVVVVFNPGATGSYNQSVSFTGGGGTNATVSGSATNASAKILATPGSASFGTIANGGSATENITVQNVGGGILSGTASVAPPFSILSGGTYSLGANQSQTVVVAFNPGAAGNYSQSVTLTGGSGASATVSGTATNFPVIQISTANVAYGSTYVGMSVTNNFKVQNVGTGTLNGTASVGAPFSILSGGTYSLGAGQSQTVVVVFSPRTVGSYNQSVAFTGGNGASATVSGIATEVPLTPPSNLTVMPLTSN
jgi:hypothetical protein